MKNIHLGFTMVDRMIMVAFISILAAVAILHTVIIPSMRKLPKPDPVERPELADN